MEIIIATPNGVIYDKKAKSITLPTESGVVTILDDHQPMISLLKAGEIGITEDEGTPDFIMSVSTGVLEVQPESHIYIMAILLRGQKILILHWHRRLWRKLNKNLKSKISLTISILQDYRQ